MQIFTKYEINEDLDEKNIELFEINLKNKNLILEDNFHSNSVDSFSTFVLLIKIKFKSTSSNDYVWLHKKS